MSLNPTAREILDAAGLKDDPVRVPHHDPELRKAGATEIHPAVMAYTGRRSTAFAEATSREPGKAMTYGQVKKEASRAAR